MITTLGRLFRLRPFQQLALSITASTLLHGAVGIWFFTLSATTPQNQPASLAWLDLANQTSRFKGEIKTAPRTDFQKPESARPQAAHRHESETTPVGPPDVATGSSVTNRAAENMASSRGTGQRATNDAAVRLESGSEVVAESPYLGSLLAELKSRLMYPRAAKLRGEQGRVEVTFTLAQGGEVRDAVVSAASPSPRLNEAALELVRGLEAFHPMPAGHPRGDLRVTVPFDYRLR